MPETDRPKAADILAKLDALIGAREPGTHAGNCDFRHSYRPTPGEKALWDALWNLLGPPAAPLLIAGNGIGATEYARAALIGEIGLWDMAEAFGVADVGDAGIGGGDWRARVSLDPNT
jgi:hypothetical protein